MAEKGTVRLYAIIEGRVQGVGYRAFVMDAARALGLRGWVRNRWDENVEVVAEGERLVLEKLVAQLQRGPRAAYVTSVGQEWQDSTGEFQDFRVRSTG
jgi:acylphosphatase